MSLRPVENVDSQAAYGFFEVPAFSAAAPDIEEAVIDDMALKELIGKLDAGKGIKRFGILLAQATQNPEDFRIQGLKQAVAVEYSMKVRDRVFKLMENTDTWRDIIRAAPVPDSGLEEAWEKLEEGKRAMNQNDPLTRNRIALLEAYQMKIVRTALELHGISFAPMIDEIMRHFDSSPRKTVNSIRAERSRILKGRWESAKTLESVPNETIEDFGSRVINSVVDDLTFERP